MGVVWGGCVLGWGGVTREWAAREAGPPAVSSDTALAATENIIPDIGHSAVLSNASASYDASGVLERSVLIFPAGFLASNRAV